MCKKTLEPLIYKAFSDFQICAKVCKIHKYLCKIHIFSHFSSVAVRRRSRIYTKICVFAQICVRICAGILPIFKPRWFRFLQVFHPFFERYAVAAGRNEYPSEVIHRRNKLPFHPRPYRFNGDVIPYGKFLRIKILPVRNR